MATLQRKRRGRSIGFPWLNLLFLALLVAVLAWMTVMSRSGLPDFMTILRLEMCGLTQSCVEQVADLHKQDDGALMLRSIYLDYLFVALYGAFFVVALLRVALRLPAPLARFTRALAVPVVFACLCDLIENFLLTAMILEGSARLGLLMSLFSAIKFIILIAVAAWWAAMTLRSWAAASAPA